MCFITDNCIPFKNTEERRDVLPCLIAHFNNLFTSINNAQTLQETPFLFAKYTGINDHGADLDNVLLYNTGLKTRLVSGMILERDRDPKANNVCYEYRLCSECDFNELLSERVRPDTEYLIDTDWIENINEPHSEREKVVHYYNLFRRWLCDKTIYERQQMVLSGYFEMVVDYNGPSSFSESGFVKRIIDGVVSAMEVFHLSDNARQIQGINCIYGDVSILRGNGNHNTINGNGWNPQDYLLDRLILKKTNGRNNSIRIKIRPTQNANVVQ